MSADVGGATGSRGPYHSLRVGVTGHRSFSRAEAASAAIDAVLDRLVTRGRALIVISSLAEGADRLVTDRVLAREDSALEVILPLSGDDYADDFGSEQSRRRFTELLAAANSVEIVPFDEAADPEIGWSRHEAYVRAGRAVVDRSDVLIAVWDGRAARGHGGTAEIVQYAVDRDVPVEVVLVQRDEPGA